jgi:hypothetical protein
MRRLVLAVLVSAGLLSWAAPAGADTSTTTSNVGQCVSGAVSTTTELAEHSAGAFGNYVQSIVGICKL